MNLKPKSEEMLAEKEDEEKKEVENTLCEDLADVMMTNEQKNLSILRMEAILAQKNWDNARDAYLAALQDYEQRKK